MRAFVFVISGLFLSTAAFAQVDGGGVMSGSGAGISSGSGASEEAPSAGGDEAQGDARRICRRVETASGSRMSYRRLCMTAEQWRSFNRTPR